MFDLRQADTARHRVRSGHDQGLCSHIESILLLSITRNLYIIYVTLPQTCQLLVRTGTSTTLE